MSTKRMPPGPKGRLRCSMRVAKDVVGAMREWQAEYGDTFTLPLMIGDWVVTCEPERVRQIYAMREVDVFEAAAPESSNFLIGANSVLRQAGEQHGHDRKLMMPPFHGERMRAWAGTMAAIGRETFLRGGLDQPMRALDRTRDVTLDVILRVVFGVRDDAKLRRFHVAVHDWAEALDPVLIFMPALQHDWLGLSPYARLRRHAERLDAMLVEQIAQARAATTPGDDMLAMLVAARYEDGGGMDDAKLLDNLRTLLFAGHDTTAILLAWVLELVHRHGDVLARLRSELDVLDDDVQPDAFARLPYLGAVIDETLRYRPIAGDVLRPLARSLEFGPWTLPAGTTIDVCPVLLHHSEALWQQPEEFLPERFLGKAPSPAIYTPFGGGSRRCLGATFARYEAAVVLGTLLREFEFELLGEPAQWRRGKVILEPTSGVPLRMHARARVQRAA